MSDWTDEANAVTWADITWAMKLIQIGPPPRKLHCGRAAWDILRDATDEATNVLGLAAHHLNRTGLYGTPVHIDPDMPDAAWKILEGDRVLHEGDFAPGCQHATLVPGVGLVAFTLPVEGEA